MKKPEEFTFEENVIDIAALIQKSAMQIVQMIGLKENEENTLAVATALALACKSACDCYKIDDLSAITSASKIWDKVLLAKANCACDECKPGKCDKPECN
jgi:hypothetical protein